MEAIPLDQGDPSWLFGADHDGKRVTAALQRARRNVEQLARLTGGRPGWTGAGLEWHRYPSGQTSLVGFAEGPDGVAFWAELDAERGLWQVLAQVAVRCGGEVDCGEHVVERLATVDAGSPEGAAAALLSATDWLVARAQSEPLTYWRERDPEAHA